MKQAMKLFVQQRDGTGIDRAVAARVKRWKHAFVASGEGSQDRFHEWECSFHLAWTRGKTRYALIRYDLGDYESRRSDNWRPFEEVVVVLHHPQNPNESWIVRHLLAEFRKAGGRMIEFYDRVGEFELEDNGDGQ